MLAEELFYYIVNGLIIKALSKPIGRREAEINGNSSRQLSRQTRKTQYLYWGHSLVHLIGALSNPDWEARRLLERADKIVKKIEVSEPNGLSTHLYQAADTKWNAWQVADRLTEEDVTALVEAYRTGTTARELATQYGIGMTTVKRMLRERGVRKRSTSVAS